MFGGLSVHGVPFVGGEPPALDMPPLLLPEPELPAAPGFALPAVPTLPVAPDMDELGEPAPSAPLPALVLGPAPLEPSGAPSSAPLLQEGRIKAVSTALEKRTPQRSKRG